MIMLKNTINNYMQENMRRLEEEAKVHGGYETWYENLEAFREQLKQYIDFEDTAAEKRIKAKITMVEKHYIDHHATGYFAPLDFCRVGFEHKLRTPAEQIAYLSEQLKKRCIRFIYVPLPCKKSIYPELVVDKSVLPEDGFVIPQWRKMIYETLRLGVEVVDVYHSFVCNKSKELYSYYHQISPNGAALIGREIAEYLKKTTKFEKGSTIFEKEKITIPGEVLGKFAQLPKAETHFYPAEVVKLIKKERKEIYMGENLDSDIMLIGDCNTQSFLMQGASIVAHSSCELQYPVVYGGRRLVYCSLDSINTFPKGSLAEKKILIYVGFASAPFVRARGDYDMWSVDSIYESAFVH